MMEKRSCGDVISGSAHNGTAGKGGEKSNGRESGGDDEELSVLCAEGGALIDAEADHPLG